jgi:hypothetical protein
MTLNYSTLTKAQKRYVDSLIKMVPSVAKTGTATRKEILDAHFALVAERKAGEPKIGFPNWLCNVSKVSRGVYAIPLPAEKVAKAKKAEKLEESKLKQIIDESDEAFPEVEDDFDSELADITSSFAGQDD